MFSLKSLFLVILVAAVFVAAFLNWSPLWSSVVVMLTLLLLIAALLSLYLCPDRRPFLICALIAGVTYGAAAFVRPLGLYDSLITTRLLFEWWHADDREGIDEFLDNSGMPNSDNLYAVLTYETPMMESFIPAHVGGDFRALQRIGHCAVALILAVIAGLVGSYVARRRDLEARRKQVE
jgi:hypothetical protein